MCLCHCLMSFKYIWWIDLEMILALTKVCIFPLLISLFKAGDTVHDFQVCKDLEFRQNDWTQQFFGFTTVNWRSHTCPAGTTVPAEQSETTGLIKPTKAN
ncbi:hypothetical protein XENORESO_006602 [Xenotaenia resolanae]|uniref:Secreted protein n=1 Tax=Xenotaenia resolanae TaxID=208358 RepID=A0ABV0VPI4_9TELE